MAEATRWPLRRIINVSLTTLAVFLIAAVIVGGFALSRLADARATVVDRIDPALQQALQLQSSLVDQETGVRGYALGADEDILNPYVVGVDAQKRSVNRLTVLLADLPDTSTALRAVVGRADTWRTAYAQPTITEVTRSGQPAPSASVEQGKGYFDQVRDALDDLQDRLNTARLDATATLDNAATTTNFVLIGVAVAFALIIIALAIGLRYGAIRPISRLAEEVRTVARGDFGHEVGRSGPREVRELGADVNLMRERILQELSALTVAHAELDKRSTDLERSNSELEQFAYVASHDLQEPLRKVASFCQLLERRYKRQLDERADQYIAFAVDGAKRMQILINDLLAFSRVGRIVRDPVVVSCDTVLAQALANLSYTVEQTGAEIEAEPLPKVSAEVPLLTAVFQNLIGNAMKFHGEEAPKVRVTVRRDGDFWEFAIADNGIGIDEEYAERIFVIFQRLHNKADYPGTGIGLAMCRKIVEYHGGRIWLDATVESGSRFCFTLPVIDEDKDADG
ncbi:sensor histidine kinase [Actinophytocola oryzae]|uniref:histidine kinase n=1 Tax=Actinophytocola oryzae TaxID=502181 RepID=A0A4V3FUF7_9PSEU|nr:sensor histidine kinase [Actinophytocola oryzae]TDV55091.1 HAMP domain-containing protein [Actinophytocola oryzae]